MERKLIFCATQLEDQSNLNRDAMYIFKADAWKFEYTKITGTNQLLCAFYKKA